MISWRYHVVSLVAVVLAFGLGILAGTSVINEGLVNEIQKNYSEAVQQRDAARADAAFSEISSGRCSRPSETTRSSVRKRS